MRIAAGLGAVEEVWMPSEKADETIEAFMARRRAEEARRRSGAVREADATRGQVGSRYGTLYAPPAATPAFRREQAAFGQERRDLDKENWWLAVPALAPAAVVLGLEGAAAIAARYAPPLTRGPLVLPEREAYLRVGDNWATRAGRRAHKAFQTRVNQKPGWDAEQPVTGGEGTLRPDARAPARDAANPEKRFQLELKPDTPSGRRAAARAVKRYEEMTGQKTRAVYYDPKVFM